LGLIVPLPIKCGDALEQFDEGFEVSLPFDRQSL